MDFCTYKKHQTNISSDFFGIHTEISHFKETPILETCFVSIVLLLSPIVYQEN